MQPHDDFGAVVRGTPAPCRAACPVGTDAAAYVALLAEGRIADAYDVARLPNPFASVCGRVCSAPCESACRRGVIDSAVSIRALKRVLCDSFGAEQGAASRWTQAVGTLPPISRASVGIIGAGPAGLAAAHDLRRHGHDVIMYEAMPEAGGMMRYGIPAFRLPRAVLDAEIDAIAGLGIEVQRGVKIGVDVSFEELLVRHAAVLITIGCQQGRNLRAPGADLPGVVRAVDFLRVENAREAGTARATDDVSQGPVVVIGGGSVAFDAARSAWRAGATSAYDGQTALDAARSARRAGERSVTMIAPESRAALPVPAEELHEATTEGVALRDGYGVVRLVGESRVTGVEIAPVLSLYDADGRFAPALDVAQSVVIAADTVVLAIGQQSDTDFLADTPSVARTPWGGVQVDGALRSTDARVWAAGDVATGPRDLIDAIAAGQRAAASMIAALSADALVDGLPHEAAASSHGAPVAVEWRVAAPRSVSSAPPLETQTRFWSGYDELERTPLPVLAPSQRDATAEVEHSLDARTGRVEAARCLRCDEHMQFSATRCIACALCVDVCPQSSLALVPAGRASLALVFDDTTCIRCGLCVHRCPTDALHFTLAPAQHPPVLPTRGRPRATAEIE